MAFLRNNKTQPEILHPLHIKTVYNFSYRLSGKAKIAAVLTEKVFLNHRSRQENKLQLLKQVWEDFVKYYGCLDFKGEDPIQQVLLSLSPELRCAVILRDIMGCSYEQIAVVLGKSDSDAVRLISIGRQQFAQLYKKPNISS